MNTTTPTTPTTSTIQGDIADSLTTQRPSIEKSTRKPGFPDDFKGGVVRTTDNASLWILADKLRPIIDSRTTGGAFDLVEAWVPFGGGPPPHRHMGADETFVILQGQLRFLIDRTWHTAGLGDVVHGPRGVTHCFRGADPAGSRMLVFVSPGNFAAFMEDIATPDQEAPNGVAPTAESIAALMAACGRHDIDMLLDWQPDGEWTDGLQVAPAQMDA